MKITTSLIESHLEHDCRRHVWPTKTLKWSNLYPKMFMINIEETTASKKMENLSKTMLQAKDCSSKMNESSNCIAVSLKELKGLVQTANQMSLLNASTSFRQNCRQRVHRKEKESSWSASILSNKLHALDDLVNKCMNEAGWHTVFPVHGGYQVCDAIPFW